MNSRLKISVSKEPQTGGIITCRNITLREKLLRFFFGEGRKVMVLIPGENVDEIAICEKRKGVTANGKIKDSHGCIGASEGG